MEKCRLYRLRKTQCGLEKAKNEMYVYYPRGCHVRMRPYRLIRDGKLLQKQDRHRDKTGAYRRLDSINHEQNWLAEHNSEPGTSQGNCNSKWSA